MLIAIIHDNNLRIKLFDREFACDSTILADYYRNSRERLGHQISLVTSFVGRHEDFFAVGNNTDFFVPM